MKEYIQLEFMKNIELKKRQARQNQSAVGGKTKKEIRQKLEQKKIKEELQQ